MEIEERTPLEIGDLKPKMPLKGKVIKIELFGAFVDVGLEKPGLIHISQLQHGHVNRVEDLVKEGDEVDVWVHKVNADTGRLELSMVKPVALDWREIKAGMKFSGDITRLENFGAFVDIGAERPGLVHISEMSEGYVSNPADLVKVGDTVEVSVLGVDRKKRQIRLSMKDAIVDEREQLEDDEPEEVTATAMEVALRKALGESDADAVRIADTGRKSGRSAKSDELEDILSRTLKSRVQTSSSE